MEKSAANGDAAAYYFVKTLNTMIKTKTKTGGGRRKYNKLKNIFQKKRKNNSKRFL
jgi:ubiquitin